jgi:PPM family protein phosphatase
VVTRALGVDPSVRADIAMLGPDPGRLLLCSDGLSDALPARTIGRVLAGVADPQQAADRLVALVLAGAAPDNVTAVVVDTVARGTLDSTLRVDHDGGAPIPEVPTVA